MFSRERDDIDERLAQFEALVEATEPPPADRFVCTCDRCYGPRYIRRERREAAA